MTLRLRLLDSIVEIETDDADAHALLSLLWSPMETRDEGEPAAVYRVARDDVHGWTATSGDSIEAVHEDLWGLADALRYAMLELCEKELERFVTLHAAAVARDDELILLAGESGAGKTTLTLALLDDGWSYLSDDLAPLAVETGLVHPFPKPLGVKDPAAFERVGGELAGLGLGSPKGSFLVPATRWDVAPKPLPVRALLFPRFATGAGLEIERLSAAKAAALASAYLRRLDPTTVALLNRLCAGATCARLSYGSSSDAIGAIEDVLNHRE